MFINFQQFYKIFTENLCELEMIFLKLDIVKKPVLPSFFDILEVKHYISGRMRVKIPSLQYNLEKEDEIRKQLLNLKGINSVEINTLIGSVLVRFDETIIEPVMLIGIILNVAGLEEEAFSRKSGKTTFALKDTIEAVDMTIYNKTRGILDLKSVIALFFIGYGIKKIRQNPVLPNGVNLLWWGYNIITGGKN